MRRIWVPQGVATLMLLWALNPRNPYGYYVLLRWVCRGVFTFLATRAVSLGVQGWVWPFGTMAGVHNPILRIHLNREIWSVVNVVTISVMVASVFAVKPMNEGKA
jgi:membrane associated rhomboid family serine protease